MSLKALGNFTAATGWMLSLFGFGWALGRFFKVIRQFFDQL